MNIITAFLYTLVAGLSTGIGSLMSLFMKKTGLRFLAGCLGFSAGVMVYIALGELLEDADALLFAEYGTAGSLICSAAFFGGMLVIALIDRLIPDDGFVRAVSSGGKRGRNDGSAPRNDGISSENSSIAPQYGGSASASEEYAPAVMRTGLMAALAMAVHNFPEGLATFVSALGMPEAAPAIVAAIAIHNIPEGIAVAAPIYMATKSRMKAFMYSLLSGLTEPLGAVIGFLVLRPFLSPTLYAVLFALTAGIMVFIAVSELIPASHKYGNASASIAGTVLGMAAMALAVIVMG